VPYGETLESAGPGPDALFAAFPADLAAPAASAPPASAPAAPAPVQTKPTSGYGAQGAGGFTATKHALGKLYVRVKDSDARAAIEIRIQPGWHLYHDELGQPDSVGKPTKVTFDQEDAVWSKARFPEPIRLDQPKGGKDGRDTWIWGHEGTIVLYARGRFGPQAKLADLEVDIAGLTCATECIPWSQSLEPAGEGPDELFAAFPADLEVGAGAASDPVAPAHAVPTAAGAIDWDAVQFAEYKPRTEIEQRSLALWLFFAFIAGVLLNVMPCVLPVVSIKVLSFVQQAGEHRSRILALGVAFAAGILAVFLVLAGLAAFANQSWGEQFQNDTFKIVMIAIVFAFSLSLFDVYEIGVPSKVGELASVRREGVADAFFKGMMATALATPCSGPFLGSTLTWALSQDKLTIFAIFTAVGMAWRRPTSCSPPIRRCSSTCPGPARGWRPSST
jgi:cytochrome c biogenesis protein CcdA